MSDDYQIKIVTTAQGDGAQKTAQQLKELSKSAAESAKVFEQARIRGNVTKDQAEYLSGLTKEAQATADLTEKTKGLEKIKVNLGKALKNLSHEIPLVGQAVAFLKNPYTAAIAVIAGFVVTLSKAITKQKEAAEASAALSAALEPALRQGAALKTIHAEAAVAAETFARALAKIGVDAFPAIAALDAVLKKTKLLNELGGDRDEVQKNLELARINQMAAAGFLPEGEAIQQRAAVEGRFAHAKVGRGLLNVAADANIERQKQFRARDAAIGATEELGPAGAALEAEKAQLQTLQSGQGAANAVRDSRLAEIAKEFGISEVELGKAQKAGTVGKLFAEAGLTSKIGPWEQKQADLRSEAQGLFAGKDAGGASITLQQGRVDAAQQRLQEIEARINQARTVEAASKQAADAASGEHDIRRAAAFGPGGTVGLEDLVRQMNAATEESKQLTEEMARFSEAYRRDNAERLKIIQEAYKTTR